MKKLVLLTPNRQVQLDLLRAASMVDHTGVIINSKSWISELHTNTRAELDQVMDHFQTMFNYRPLPITFKS